MVWSEFSFVTKLQYSHCIKKLSNTSIVLNLKLYYIHIENFFHVFKSSQYFQYVDFWLQETLWELSPINCNSFKKKASTGYLRTESIVKNYKIGHFCFDTFSIQVIHVSINPSPTLSDWGHGPLVRGTTRPTIWEYQHGRDLVWKYNWSFVQYLYQIRHGYVNSVRHRISHDALRAIIGTVTPGGGGGVHGPNKS